MAVFKDYLESQKKKTSKTQSDGTFLSYLEKVKSGNIPSEDNKNDNGLFLSQGETKADLGSKKEQVADRFSSEKRGNVSGQEDIYEPDAENLTDEEKKFIQSEKAEAQTRAAKQAKITEAKDKAASTTETAEEKNGIDRFIDSLNYINARGAQALGAWNENLNTLGEAAYNAIQSGASAFKSKKPIAVSASKGETISDSEVKSAIKKGGAITAAKEAAEKAAAESFEKAATEDINTKTLTEVEEKYSEQSSNPIVKALGDLNAGIANMLPSIAASAVNPALGAISMGAVSTPDAYTEARKNGATVSQAQKMAAREAVNQGLGDILIGGIAGTGKGLAARGADALSGGAFSRYTKKALGKLASSPAGKTAVKYFGNVFGEGVEESLQSLITTLNEKITYNDDAKVNWGDVAYEGVIGGLMGGVFGAAQIPLNYKAYKNDADLVNDFAKAADRISSADDADTVKTIGEFIVSQMDEAIENAGDDNDTKERAEFIKTNTQTILDNIENFSESVISGNNSVSEAIESIAESPSDDIVESTARLVDTVAENIEPDEDAVNKTIDIVREKIIDQHEEASSAATSEEKREAQINESILKEIDSTLREQREEIEQVRTELTGNNLTVPSESDIVSSEEKSANILEYTTQKHTKTGEALHVLKNPSHISSEDYSRIKNQLKKIGGYYSKFVKGFIIPDESIGKATDILSEIGVGLNNYTSSLTGDTSVTGDTSGILADAMNVGDKGTSDVVSDLDKGEKIPESGIILEKDADDYSVKHQRVIDEYANAVDKDFRTFIDNSIDGNNQPNLTYQLANISPGTAAKIKEAIGINPEGWQTKIESRMIQHIWKRHGDHGQQDSTMKNRDDIARIQYVIENPDSIERTDNSKAYREPHPYLENKTRAAKSVLISKKINGTYYVVEAIPDSERKTAYIVTSFMSKKKTASTTDNAEASPVYTSADNDVNALSDENQTSATIPDRSVSIIAQDSTDVKTDSPESQIADFVAAQLNNGEKITSTDLQTAANNAYGGTQAEGAYDVKSMTDALELGVNKYLLSAVMENSDTFNSDNAGDAVDSIHKINEDILDKIPTQTKRSDEQISLQQFSTPPNIAYTAAWTANIDSSDSVLEPSAGIGGLAVFGKAFGADTVVNELSERRLDSLKKLPFDAFYNENAEQIDNILPDSVKPSVILMNPPFSSTGGRTKNSTKNAIPHIEQALYRLEDGGRLVAILGRGMSDDSATFKSWWNDIRNEYNIRANIGINGENYRKYGTTFDVQLVVIDKTGPQTGETITGYFDNLDDIPSLLEGVRNDRTRTAETNRRAEQNEAVSGSGETDGKTVSRKSRSDTDGGDRGVSGRADSDGNVGVREESADERPRSGGESDVSTESVQPKTDIQIPDVDRDGGRSDGRNTSETGTEQGSDRVDSRNSGAGADGESIGVVRSELTDNKTEKKSSGKKTVGSDDGVYAEYKTVPLTVKGAKKHPAKLVESSAMSAVSSPKLTYKPNIAQSLIDSGALSDAQLENISYAGQAHEQTLSNGQRKGYFIGDGTGVGKGRQLAGIILDNWNSGRRKAIWISENKNLSEDARRDWKDLGGDPEQIVDWEKVQKKGFPAEGIVFIPYSSLSGGKTKNRETTTLEALEKWFGKEYDGVIVYDEAHNMGNLIPMKGARGTKKPSQKAVAGDKLQSDLPNTRVTYASATGATNIENLSYAARLGLWGEGTSFRDSADFITKIGRSGIAAMELVARDMKSMGVYLARSISYDGVVYDNIQHKLTSTQRKMYDGMSEGWQIVLQNFDKAMQATNSENAKDVKQRRGQVYGNMQQFYNQVLTSMAMPTVIKDIEKQLAAGKSCVIQLVNTNEAAQDRAVSDAKAEGKSDLDSLDITPRQLLVGYVENAFPVNQYEEYLDDNGNKASRLALDSNGKPIINKQALRMKEALIEQLNEISIPEGPLDMLLNHFGADQVAEITGRSGRVLTVRDENGNEHKQYVSRDSGKANIAETKDFQDGKKRILVFSGAGSTGRSFHSDKRAQNQQQRIHYVLQPGWEASKAVQGFGRTHRSNQVNTPVFRLVSTDVMGHKRFITSIARRLDQLGALTKGQRQTGSGVFGEKDNLESPLSAQALREFYRRLGEGRINGLDAQSVLGKMGLDKAFYDEYGRFVLNETIASDIPKFLNRILALPVDEQNEVFTAFEEIRDGFYQAALESGKLDTGLENVKADKIDIVQDDVVYTDPSTGAETRYVRAKLYTKPNVIKTIGDAESYRNGFEGIYRMQDGSVRAVYRVADRTDEWGRVTKQYVLISPNTGIQSRYNENTLKAKTEAVPKNEWESAWNTELENVPEFNENEKHMITGALLPIWNRLPETENVKAQRIVASDGSQYLGRIIQKDSIDSTLRQLDVKSQKTEYSGDDLYDSVVKKGNTVTMRGLYGGTITISRRRVSNENRIEISGAGASYLSDKYPGIFSETIQFQKRTFIPTGDKGIEILGKMANELGVRSVDSEDSGAYYSLGSSRGKWENGKRDSQVMSISELTRQASRIFGVEINTGKIGKAGASGIFKTHAGTIRTRQYGDLPTISHELGHLFDKRYNLRGSPYLSTLTEVYDSKLKESGYSEAQIPAEAVAEYFESYLNDREKTERRFKEFTNWMYDTISASDAKKLEEYSGMANAYFAADLERRADAQIHTRVEDNSVWNKSQLQVDELLRNPSAYLGLITRRATRLFIDDLVDLRAFGKTYDLAMFEKTADSITAGRLTSAMTNRYGTIVGDSLSTILSNGSINDMNRLDFDKYLIACVALDRITAAENAGTDQKIGTLVYGDEKLQDKESIIERIARYERENPTFKDTAEEVYKYNDNLLSLAVDSGMISEKLHESLQKSYPHYVPLYRVINGEHGSDGKAKKGYANQSAPISRFKGSGRDIYSPIENIILNTEKFTKACMRNDVMSEFADYIDSHEDLGWAAEKVPETKVFDVISTDSIGERLSHFSSDKLSSLKSETIEELFGEIMEFIGDYAGMWKPASRQGRNVVSVMRNGKREYYEIHDSDLFKCLTNLDARQNGLVMNFLGSVTAKFKVLTTGSNPIFGVTNVGRDIKSGYVSSTTTDNPFVYTRDFIKAWWSAIRNTPDYKEFLRNGGGWAGALTQDYKYLKKSEEEVVKTTNAMKKFVSVISDAVPRLVDAGESASRYAEYKRARDLGIDALEAIRKSQEVTVNFARGGTVTKEIDKIIPYFRASVNSMYHLYDVLTKGDKKQLRSKWSKMIALNSIPAAISFIWRLYIAPELFDEDEEEIEKAYDSLSAYNKNAYWCYYVGNGQFYRSPKPKDMTVFSTVIERLVEYSMLGEADALYGLPEYVSDSLLPPTAKDATIFGTALSLAQNKTFTGSPIVPTAYQNLAPELQYKGDTSNVAIALGKLLNISPMQIDFILEDNTGYVGSLITNLSRNDGEVNLGFLNKFVVDSVYSTDTANIFYATKDIYDKNAASYKHTGGENPDYTLEDVYGKYKYGKIADTYSSLNSLMKSESSEDTSREMKSRMNDFLKAVNDTGITDLDKAVIEVAETTGTDISDIAPYVVVPDSVTYTSKGYKEKFSLTFDEMIEYYTESQLVLTAWYTDILNSGYDENTMAEAMTDVKNEVSKQMRDLWEEKKFKQKYN